MPTAESNAQGSDASSHQNNLDISDDVIMSHPKFKELEGNYAAARTGMDKSNLTKKQLEAELAKYKTLAGEEEPPEESIEPSYVTKADLDARTWELKHERDLEVYGDDKYRTEIEQGIPKEIALEYAKLRYQKAPNTVQVTRQQTMASAGSTSTRDLSNIEITDEDREDMKTWGYSEKTLLKQKALKRARQAA